LIQKSATRRYILYVLGEILLIVIGILIALQISNWNLEREERKEEVEILRELQASIQVDRELLKERFEMVKTVISRIERLKHLFSTGRKSDSLEILFGSVYGAHRFEMNTASFEALKSRGFNLISDSELRRQIIKVYDQHRKKLDDINGLEANVTLDVFRPYYLDNFTNIRIWTYADAYDEYRVMSDPYYGNLLDHRLFILSFNHLEKYPEVIEDMNELLTLIEEDLAGD
jgi:hypothetical protein